MTATAQALYRPRADTPGSGAIAHLCKAAGDPRRVQILGALTHDSFGVLELCRIFSMRQPVMSHHLKVLAEAGLVSRRREGNNIYYRRTHRTADPLDALKLSLFQALDQIELSGDQCRRLEAIQRERAAASVAFFADNASKFIEQQELIATPVQYLEPMLQLIDTQPLPEAASALELGTGTGWLLPHLARIAASVTAVDSSAEMLDSARQFCRDRSLDSVNFVHGDNGSLINLKQRFDLAVVNMVLHHTPSPATVIADLAGVLRPGGALLVCDLDAHDQAWVCEACGDLWLGVAAEDLHHWATKAGLVATENTVSGAS